MEPIPKPKPAKIRPTTNRGRALVAACIATPAAKMRTARITDRRIPKRSAAGVTNRAPRNVPADRMKATRDCSRPSGVILHDERREDQGLHAPETSTAGGVIDHGAEHGNDPTS